MTSFPLTLNSNASLANIPSSINDNVRVHIVSLDGVPGSGKSTRIANFAKSLSNNSDYTLIEVEEPVKEFEESGLLELYYQDPKRWGYTFQTTAAELRIQKMEDAINKFKDDIRKRKEVRASLEVPTETLVLLSERSLASDAVFMTTLHRSGTVTDIEYSRYLAWCNLWKKLFGNTSISVCHVYLDCSLDKSIERIFLRNRKAEQNFDVDYQRKLINTHEEFISDSEKRGIPVLRLDGNIDIHSNQEAFKCQLSQIADFVTNQL